MDGVVCTWKKGSCGGRGWAPGGDMGGMRRSAVEKDGGVSIFSPGPQTAPEARREELQADIGADCMRVFARFWGLSKIITQSWEKYIIFFSRVRS